MKEEEKKNDAPVVQPIPENLPEEFLPLYDWWKANGNQLIVTVAIVAIVAAAFFGIRQYRSTKISGANEELLKANSVEDLESAVAKYSGSKAGKAIRLRLAKAYYDIGNYQSALDTYDACISKGVPQGFEDIAIVGRACSLEGAGKLDEALAVFRAFQKDHADSYLLQQAQFGEARVLCLQGKKPEAKKLLENLKAKATGKSAEEMAIANLMDVIDRYVPRQQRSLFDMANDAAKKGTVTVPAIAPATKPAGSVVPPVVPAKPVSSAKSASVSIVTTAPALAPKAAVKAEPPAAPVKPVAEKPAAAAPAAKK